MYKNYIMCVPGEAMTHWNLQEYYATLKDCVNLDNCVTLENNVTLENYVILGGLNNLFPRRKCAQS